MNEILSTISNIWRAKGEPIRCDKWSSSLLQLNPASCFRKQKIRILHLPPFCQYQYFASCHNTSRVNHANTQTLYKHYRTVTLSRITLVNISSLTFLFDWQWRSIDLCALSEVISLNEKWNFRSLDSHKLLLWESAREREIEREMDGFDTVFLCVKFDWSLIWRY